MTQASERQTTEPQLGPGLALINRWLVGIGTVRSGAVPTFFLPDPDTGELVPSVTPQNATAVENRIRYIYSENYPELAIIDAESVEIMGELNPGPLPVQWPKV
jgi:hypothetical protein